MTAPHTRRVGWVAVMLTLLVAMLTSGVMPHATPAAAAVPVSTHGLPGESAAPGTGQIAGILVAARDLPAEFATVAAAESANLAPGRVRQRIHFHFDKNQQDPTNSRLILYRVTYSADQPARYTKLGSWRAGSGLGTGPDAKDACASNKGWLPNGFYDGGTKDDPVVYYTNFDRGVIFGTVWHLQNKHCKPNGKGTKRTALFIHSEMTPDRTQACGSREDQCWDGPTDYVSEGCIKLKPGDIADAARLAKANGGPKPGQQRYRNLLVVTN